MPSPIAAVPPSSHVPHHAWRSDGSDVPEYAFSDLWQDRKEGLSFGDVLDIVNPLQHIPVLSNIYRLISGDEIGVGARLAGGALFGGPFGALAAGALALFEGASGRSVEQHVAALFEDGPDAEPAGPQIATAPTPDNGRTGPGDDPAVPVTVATAPPAAQAAQAGATVAPPAAVMPTNAKTPPTPHVVAERQRVAQAVEQAQRAQAGLLLASMEVDRAAMRQAGGDRDAEPGAAAAPADSGPPQAFRQHPYMLPPGAPPQLISRAMEQALVRYQSMLQQRETGAPAR